MARTVAFFSYTRADDRTDDGRLSDIRARLEERLNQEMDETVMVFQDTDDIKLGAEWRKRLDEALGAAVYLIPVITPNWFASAPCQEELARFREIERERGETGLILPIYWIRDRALEAKRFGGHEGRAFIHERQYRDWKVYRRPITPREESEEAILQLAEHLADELHERDHAGPPPAAATSVTVKPGQTVTGRLPMPAVARTVPDGLIEVEGHYPDPLSIFRDTLEGGGQGPEMVVMPTGDFMMGSPEDEGGHNEHEGPRHQVEITSPFALGRCAVTFDEYDAYCTATNAQKPGDQAWGRGRRPVINVSWEDAAQYCNWLSDNTGTEYRLPSEAEWEYACRAGSETPFEPTVARVYRGRSILSSEANINAVKSFGEGGTGEFRKRTVCVDAGGFRPNAWHLTQMHGNVWEWCDDDWSHDYEVPRQQRYFEAHGERRRRVRGGSWNARPHNARSAAWIAANVNDRNHHTGFRVARDIP